MSRAFNVFVFVLSIYCLTISTISAGDKDSLIFKPHDLYPDEWLQRFPHSYTPIDFYPKYSALPSNYQNVNLSQDSAPQNEPHVKISRKNPDRVVAAWRDFRTGIYPPLRRIGYSYSTDGGTTWSVSALLPQIIPNVPLSSDPVVGVDTAGNFYIMTISINGITNYGEVWVFKSYNQGETFDSVYLVANGPWYEDKDWLVTDLKSGSPYENTLYVGWRRFSPDAEILISKSTNSGINWSTPVNVNEPAMFGIGPALSTGSNGEVYISWTCSSNPPKIIFDKSTDGGATFGTDKIISTAPDAWLPSMATDISGGSRDGYIYVTWEDGSYGDLDVFLSFSSNGGTNWSIPKRVNNDSIGNGKKQYWPSISVNDSGNIAIIFYDTRNTPNDSIIEAYLAYSTDGDLNFTNELLSSQPSFTNTPNGSIRFGDYIGIDYYGSRIVPVWTDERTSDYNMEIYTAVINTTIGIQPIANEIPTAFELYQNYPNPFNPITNIRFDLHKSSQVKLVIYNILGKEVATLMNENLSAGSYEIDWDGSGYPSGVYFYKMVADDFVQTRKLVLMK